MDSLNILIITCLSLLITMSNNVHGNAELEALMLIKSSLDPENKVLRSWTKDKDPCDGSFEGVACNEYHKVGNISLQAKGLTGKLSPALAELKCLSGLYLHYNSLSGDIPKEISNLTELTDLYLDVNNLSGVIPSEIGNMASLQVLQLCCNQLSGNIPPEIGLLKRLTVLFLQKNKITGKIPPSLGELNSIKRLDLSFNKLSGTIPRNLADIQSLQVLNIKNNSLFGFVPSGLRRLNEGFQPENNPQLCGFGFSQLRSCTSLDNVRINGREFSSNETPDPNQIPESANFHRCNNNNIKSTGCKKSTRFSRAAVIAAVATITITMIGVVLFVTVRFRRGKQKIGNASESSDPRVSPSDNTKEFRSKSASPLVSLEYSNGWDQLGDGISNGLGSSSRENGFRLNMEEIEAATQYFSEANLLGKSKFSAVYKGVLRDGSAVATRKINITSCKSEESEFVKGLDLLFSLRHENLVKLRGFCCSRSRNECFLVYDFAPNGKLSQFLDVHEGSDQQVLDWSKRVSIITGIAKGIQYLHSTEPNKPPIVHQNISTEKVLIDRQFNPVIADSGLPKLLADDIVFSALKTSAAMGYLAPEYVTTGRFTKKSDVYAFGVIVLQVVSGQIMLSSSIRSAVNSSRLDGFVDGRLNGEFSEFEAAELGRLALDCTNEDPEERPSVDQVVQRLTK